jgi:hypothetical protein
MFCERFERILECYESFQVKVLSVSRNFLVESVLIVLRVSYVGFDELFCSECCVRLEIVSVLRKFKSILSVECFECTQCRNFNIKDCFEVKI